MQDRYTGDVGDFGKYGLLRQLCGLRDGDVDQLKLGVVWYRPNSELIASETVPDGKFIAYLCPNQKDVGEKQKREYRCCDPTLYDALRKIVMCGDRRIEAVEKSGLLGPDTVFYGHQIPNPSEHTRGGGRVEARLGWAEGALGKTAGRDVVFLDPDNGLEPRGLSITSAKAPKYAYLSEVEKWFRRDQSLVIYHHLGRHRPHDAQIDYWLERLRDEFKPHDIFALRFRRGTSRVFFVLAAKRHAPTLRQRADELLASPWREHFEGHQAALAGSPVREVSLNPMRVR